MTAVTLAPARGTYFCVRRQTAMRSFGPNLEGVLAAIVMIMTIGALVFWIMGATPRLD